MTWRGRRWLLLPERAAWLADAGLLLIADPHIGKGAAFQASGVPAPETTADDLGRLARAVLAVGARRLVVLGDLLHAPHSRRREVLEQLVAWRARLPGLDVTLVRGNHDLGAGDPPAEAEIRCVDEPHEAFGLELRHQPRPTDPRGARDDRPPSLAGHVHPAVCLRDLAGVVRLPCFLFGASEALLPAFGSFTGMHSVRRGDEACYVVTPDGVMPAPRRRRRLADRPNRGPAASGDSPDVPGRKPH